MTPLQQKHIQWNHRRSQCRQTCMHKNYLILLVQDLLALSAEPVFLLELHQL